MPSAAYYTEKQQGIAKYLSTSEKNQGLEKK